jgi:hypothetical protein
MSDAQKINLLRNTLTWLLQEVELCTRHREGVLSALEQTKD